MSPPKSKKELQAFQGIMNYLSNFSPTMTEVCKPLYRLTFMNTEWTLNRTFLGLFNKVKTLIIEYACIKFYDELQTLYLETDTYGSQLATGLLQARDGMNCPGDELPYNTILRPIAFANKSLSSTERRHSNTE